MPFINPETCKNIFQISCALQSSQHQKNNLLQAIFFAWLAEGRTGPMVIKGVHCKDSQVVTGDYRLVLTTGDKFTGCYIHLF